MELLWRTFSAEAHVLVAAFLLLARLERKQLFYFTLNCISRSRGRDPREGEIQMKLDIQNKRGGEA